MVASLRSKLKFIMDDSIEFSSNTKTRFLLAAQTVFGLLWLDGVWWKISVDGSLKLDKEVFEYVIKQGSENPVFGFYGTITDKLLLPNLTFFLIMTIVVELVLAALFISGRYIRLASAVSFLLTITIILSIINAPNEWHWSYFLMLLVSAIFFVVPTKFERRTESSN